MKGRIFKQKLTRLEIIEVAGVLVVAASLIFVGLQLRQDRLAAEGEQYFNRTEASLENIRTRIGSEEYLSTRAKMLEEGSWPVWWKDSFEHSAGLTYRETAALILDLQMIYLSYDNLRFQYSKGLIDENYWLNVRRLIKDDLRLDVFRAAYSNYSSNPEMTELISELVSEIRQENQ